MTVSWAVTLLLTLAQFGFICRKRCSGRIRAAQGFAAAAALVMVILYYAPCARATYEWTQLGSEVATSVLDMGIAVEILVLTRCMMEASALEWAAILLITLHQHVKLQWHWSSLLFRAPDGFDAYLNQVRFASNLACIVAIGLLAHYQHEEKMKWMSSSR